MPDPIVDAYLELPSTVKTVIKTVVMSLVYALAKKYDVEVEYEDQLKPMLSNVPTTGGQIIINANIAEAKPQVNINIDVKTLEDVIRLLEYLFQEADKNMPYKTRRLLEQRVRRAERLPGGSYDEA